MLGGSTAVFLYDIATILHQLLENGINFDFIFVHLEGMLKLLEFYWTAFNMLNDGFMTERP